MPFCDARDRGLEIQEVAALVGIGASSSGQIIGSDLTGSADLQRERVLGALHPLEELCCFFLGLADAREDARFLSSSSGVWIGLGACGLGPPEKEDDPRQRVDLFHVVSFEGLESLALKCSP